MMEAARTSETSVDIQLTQQYIPEDSELHTRRRETLKSHTIFEVHCEEDVDVGLLDCNTVKMEAVCFFETASPTSQTQRDDPEDQHRLCSICGQFSLFSIVSN